MLISTSVEEATMELTTKSSFVATRLLESTPTTLLFSISQLNAPKVAKLCRDMRHSNFGSHLFQDCYLSIAKTTLLSQKLESISWL
jgi:hypothetical protein